MNEMNVVRSMLYVLCPRLVGGASRALADLQQTDWPGEEIAPAGFPKNLQHRLFQLSWRPMLQVRPQVGLQAHAGKLRAGVRACCDSTSAVCCALLQQHHERRATAAAPPWPPLCCDEQRAADRVTC